MAGDSDEMLAVMRANFEACNNEDLEALMDTCSVDMPRREEFREDAGRLWEEKDIYYSLISFTVIRVEGDRAIASVVQGTTTRDRKAPSDRDLFVRNGTGLLTEEERVEYKVAMKKDGRKWKCLLVLTEPVKWDPESRR
jgi:hypothetical protein